MIDRRARDSKRAAEKRPSSSAGRYPDNGHSKSDWHFVEAFVRMNSQSMWIANLTVSAGKP